MSRYIDKNKLIKRLEMRSIKGDCKFCNRFEECMKINSRKGSHLNCWEMIDMPEADVVEVKHAKWIDVPLNMSPEYFAYKVNLRTKCSACSYAMPQEYPRFKICPCCGAKMDGDI